MNSLIPLRTLRRAGALLAALALAHSARPEVPAAPAAFKPVSEFSNPWAPFVPGAVKVSTGRAGGKATMEIETHRAETRSFLLEGQPVECAILEEQEFVAGVLVDASVNFRGEDTDGNVFYFGEISTTYEDGAPVSHEGSWLVGGATQPGDPEDTLAVPAPFLFMPAQPAVGDTFCPEALPDETETVTVLSVDATLQTALGLFDGVLKLREASLPGDEVETQWVVAGLGVVKSREKGESLRLRATSLQPVGP